MTAGKRWIIWAVLLVAAAGLVAFDRDGPQPGAIVEAVTARATNATAPARSNAAPRVQSAAAPEILKIRPRAEPGDVDNAFAARDWRPPPPPPAPVTAAPAPRPTAPPLPYVVFGKQLEDGAWQVFLRRNERVLVVRAQETIDNAYRVDEIRPPTMILTYLPLQQRLSMPIGGAE